MDRTLLILQRNSANWKYTAYQILEEHCTVTALNLVNTLQILSLEDWWEALQVELRWAQRRFPHLQADAIQ